MAFLRYVMTIVVVVAFQISVNSALAVDFPGNSPGLAKSMRSADEWTLSNDVVSESWLFNDHQLLPSTFSNKLNGHTLNQKGRELFRLGTRPEAQPPTGYEVAIRMDGESVTASVSRDGIGWVTLASFPRSTFPGKPKIIRIGKMSSKGTDEDYVGAAGDLGECSISSLTPLPTQKAGEGRFAIKANANRAAVREFSLPYDATSVTCRIDKGSDVGMTWGPALALIWNDGQQFILIGVRDQSGLFNVSTAAGERIVEAHPSSYPAFDSPASSFEFTEPRLISLQPDPTCTSIASRISGKAVESDAHSKSGIKIRWRAELRDGSNYIRQIIEVSAEGTSIPLTSIELIDLSLSGASTIGTVPGCPIAGEGFFAGFEMPGSVNAIDSASARIGIRCHLQLADSQSESFSEVVGVAAENQLRRSFLCYVERERARPSKPFLHYNSWYDLGYDDASEGNLLHTIEEFDRELVRKRGVQVDSFLIDDGWDNVRTGLWAEDATRFPDGMVGVGLKAKKLNARLGLWISPLGGYGGRDERTATARSMGLIPAAGDLDLSYPKYNAWFLNRCQTLMQNAGVNIFKWDKAGEGVSAHFMALLGIANKLHAANSELFINVTVGTWPSPFWLNFIDSTWRDGSGDVGWEGKGADPNNPHDRERWLTYRDGYCYKLFVQRSPLYPLNSVMHHGIVLGKYFQGKDLASSGADLRHEARSFFANGTSLQELYLTPSLMTPAAWDDVAEAAKWAHANADVLVDSHWIGGDPLKLQPYGYASWSPRKAILMLRNPSDKPTTTSLDAVKLFELPASAARRFSVNSAYADTNSPISELTTMKSENISLQPFEVIVLEFSPKL